MQDGRKAVWSIPYVFVAFFQSLKQNYIAYLMSSCPDCISKIPQVCQSAVAEFSSVNDNFKCLYKKVWNLFECPM